MSIRVGTIKYQGGRKVVPSYPGYSRVEVMTASTTHGDLSPFQLVDEKGRIFENVWQFAKVYKNVPATTCRYSRWDSTVIWQHPAETHVDEKGELTPEYWKWREKGMNNMYAVRYPVGFHHRKKCLYAYWNDEKLDYIQARKKFYVPEYIRLLKMHPKFQSLKKLVDEGEKLLIIEVDGPREESLQYYKDMYGVGDDFIENNTIEVTEDNLSIMLEDSKHPFGHGYCVAMALLDMEII